MARNEAKLLRSGQVENINQELLRYVEGRTLEAIKGKRRAAAYKRLVQDILSCLSPESPSSSSSSSSEGDRTIQPVDHGSVEEYAATADASAQNTFNMGDDTIIYMSPEAFVYRLNDD